MLIKELTKFMYLTTPLLYNPQIVIKTHIFKIYGSYDHFSTC